MYAARLFRTTFSRITVACAPSKLRRTARAFRARDRKREPRRLQNRQQSPMLTTNMSESPSMERRRAAANEVLIVRRTRGADHNNRFVVCRQT